MKKYLLLAASLTCMNSPLLFASAPTKCPDIREIQSTGLNYIHASDGLGYVTAYMPKAKFGTDQDWNFILTGGDISTAKNADDAMKKAKKILTQIGSAMGAPHTDDNQLYQCRYESSFVIIAMAYTPPVDPDSL